MHHFGEFRSEYKNSKMNAEAIGVKLATCSLKFVANECWTMQPYYSKVIISLQCMFRMSAASRT